MSTPILDYSMSADTNRRWSDWFTETADKFRRPIFAMLILSYLAAFNGQWRLEPDSALYLSIGKNLAEGKGYTFRGVPDRLAYPGLPYVHAAMFKIFGTQTLLPVHILMMLAALATLALTYRLFLLFGPRGDAVMATLGVGITQSFFRYGYELRNDMPFLLGVMGFLVGYEAILAKFLERPRRASDPVPATQPKPYDWFFLIGGFALAVLMRPAMWALVLAVVATIVVAMFRPPIRPRRLAITLAAFVVVLVAVFAFFKFDPRRAGGGHQVDAYEDAIVSHARRDPMAVVRQTGENIIKFTEQQAPQALYGFEFVPWMNTFFVAVMLIAGLALVRWRVMWAAWIAATLLMIFVVQPGDRYMLAVLPLLIFGWWQSLKWISRRSWRRTTNFTFLILLGVGALPNGLRVMGLIVEQRELPFLKHYKDGRFNAYPNLCGQIRDRIEPDAKIIVMLKTSRIFSFLTERNCYEERDIGSFEPYDSPLYFMFPTDRNETIEKIVPRSMMFDHPIISVEISPHAKLLGGNAGEFNVYRVMPIESKSK